MRIVGNSDGALGAVYGEWRTVLLKKFDLLSIKSQQKQHCFSLNVFHNVCVNEWIYVWAYFRYVMFYFLFTKQVPVWKLWTWCLTLEWVLVSILEFWVNWLRTVQDFQSRTMNACVLKLTRSPKIMWREGCLNTSLNTPNDIFQQSWVCPHWLTLFILFFFGPCLEQAIGV